MKQISNKLNEQQGIVENYAKAEYELKQGTIMVRISAVNSGNKADLKHSQML